MPLSEPLRKEISDLVAKERVVLFMKGTRHQPQCGFSAQCVQILDEFLPEYETVNVLSSPEMRDGIKEFSQWPTIPQLYIGGQFVGGCDIVRDLHASGEIAKLLGGDAEPQPVPKIRISDSAKAAFLSAGESEPLHLQIDRQFSYDLFFGPPQPNELEVEANGLTFLIDPGSARRADGMSIDFVDGPEGGFKIDNPNEPAKVKQLSARDAKAMIDRGELVMFDVRPEAERRVSSIPGVRSLEGDGHAYLEKLDRKTPIAFHCHHGPRSQGVAEQALREGFTTVYNLKGGIEAWSVMVDSSVPRY